MLLDGIQAALVPLYNDKVQFIVAVGCVFLGSTLGENIEYEAARASINRTGKTIERI